LRISAALLSALGPVLVAAAARAQDEAPKPGAPVPEAVEAEEAAPPARQDDSAPPEQPAEPRPIDPRSFLHYAMGRDYQKNGKLDKAIEEYEKAAELDPTSTLILRDLASAYVEKRDVDSARKTYGRAIHVDPADVESHYRLARLAQRQGATEQAEQAFKQVLALEGEPRKSRYYGLALYRYAVMLDRARQTRDAADVFANLVRWLRDAPEEMARDRELGQLMTREKAVIMKAVQLYLQAKAYREAVALIREKPVDLLGRPGFGPIVVSSLLNDGQTDLALEVALEIQKQQPTEGVSYRLLAQVFDRKGDHAAFVRAFRTFLAQQPEMNVVKALLVKGLLATGGTEEAGRLIDEIIDHPTGLEDVGAETLVPSTINALLEHQQNDLAVKMALAAQKRWPRTSASYSLLVRVYETIGDNDGLVATLERLREAHPDVHAITLLLGKKLLEMGRADDGVAVLEPLLATDAVTAAAARVVLLDYYKASAAPEQALKVYAQLLSEQRDQEQSERLVGDLTKFIFGLDDAAAAMKKAQPVLEALHAEGDKTIGPDLVLGMLAERFDLAQAAGRYEAALEIDPESAVAHERRVAALVGLERLSEALSALQQAVTQVRRDRFFMQLGALFEVLDRDADAVATYATALRINPSALAARFNLLRVLWRMGRTEDAVAMVEKDLAERSDRPDAYVVASHFHAYLSRDRSKALEVMDRGVRALADHPGEKLLLLYKIPLLEQNRRYDEALDLCDQLVAGDPQLESDVTDMRVNVLVASEKYDEAERIVRKLIDAEPEKAEPRYLLASVLTRKGDDAGAEALLKAILEDHPRNAPANNDLGYMWADRGEHLERSERMIRLAARQSPGSAAYLDSLGWVLYKRNRLDQALMFLERSVRIDPQVDPVVWEHLGDTLVRLNRSAEAGPAYERAQKILETPGRTPGRDDQQIAGRLRDKLEAVRKGRSAPVAPLGHGVE
jgi:tetratricopeptide (TPR) repeat protein